MTPETLLIALAVGFLLGFVPLFGYRVVAAHRIAAPRALPATAGFQPPPAEGVGRGETFRVLRASNRPGLLTTQACDFRAITDEDLELAPDAPCWTCGGLLREGDHTRCE